MQTIAKVVLVDLKFHIGVFAFFTRRGNAYIRVLFRSIYLLITVYKVSNYDKLVCIRLAKVYKINMVNQKISTNRVIVKN